MWEICLWEQIPMDQWKYNDESGSDWQGVFFFKQKLDKYAFERPHRGNIVQNAATAYQNNAELAIYNNF